MYTVLHETLFKAVKQVKRPINELTTLNYALLNYDGEKLTLTTTDGKETIAANIPCKLDGEPFAVCVPMVKKYTHKNFIGTGSVKTSEKTGYPLYDFLKICTEYRFTLTLESGCLVMRARNSKTTFNCIPAYEFPGYVAPVKKQETTPVQKTYTNPHAPIITCRDPQHGIEINRINAKYAWIESWENDPKKRIYRNTLHNARVNMRAELAALEAINVTSEFKAIIQERIER